ncbi:vomeronasal type-2 receptor 26-like [Elgaria multicarinata webbii]|uniref:vomeronasal type-2 receptor 26-like n=1 Tax=Elgaria multicarinata webbii TaxID=159646 RepID=UPI002FCD0F42
MVTKFYQHILTLAFAVSEVNKNPKILPNVTLGFHIFDSYNDERMTYRTTLDLISNSQRFVPNYECGTQKNLIAIIGGMGSDISFCMADVLHLYKIPQNIKPHWSQGDGFLQEFWEQAFDCSFPNPSMSKLEEKICTGDEKLETLPSAVFEMAITGHSYSIYNAVYAAAYALHAMDKPRAQHRTKMRSQRLGSFQSWKRVKVGQVYPKTLEGKGLIVNDYIIEWPRGFNQVMPLSVCSDACQPGYQKKRKEGEKFCCYDCALCPAGKISYKRDMNGCFNCPEEQYPSMDQDRCIPKAISFLSYEEPLGISLTAVSIYLSLITVLVLGMFIKHKNTPIVKANNQNLTYTLLISLFLCFLCSLLFVGQPGKVTCFLQHSLFGVIFSVAISSVLAKSITVVLAFKATKPGSNLRTWVGKRLSISFMLSGTFIQAGICAVCLGISPPFPVLDMQSEAGEIIVECSSGSATMFCLILGYLGLLAIISFTVAFIARKLPDSFNEAKFITFSMLMFCSVWLSFVPAYLSTKGKYMVAVEIFSILASSAGLLGCIFIPKCYIIVLRPELNSKGHLIRKNNFKM